MTTTDLPQLGQLVQIRARQWVVTDVRPSTLAFGGLKPLLNGPQNLLNLSSVEDDGLGEELQVVWEIEPGAKVVEKIALPEPADFDAPEKLDAFLDAVRWGAASTADVKNIQSPFRSGIEIEDYQLDPVVRAIQMPRVNLLIADDVGLGKTIEAGMVALELIIRHRARKILVVCPSALQIQWRDQMRDKFGLDFRIVDSTLMRELRRRRGIHVNPWSHFPRLITSIDFLKRERPLRLMRETLPAPGGTIYPRKYDLLIVDEAHNCAPSGAGKYASDSLRTQALRELAPHFEHKLFLTATPHNGYRESFSALLELLDNQRFSRGTEPDRKQLDAVMVRRLKSDPSFAFNHLGIRRFPPRVLEPIEVPYTDEEREIHTALRTYTKLRSAKAEDNAERFATEFVLKTLKKRLFSCPAAFLTTLEQHEKSLNAARRKVDKPSYKTLQLELDRMDEEYADDTDYDEATADALDTATRLFAEPTAKEVSLLKQMKEWAKRARGQRDSKVKQLVAWLSQYLKPGGKWSKERVIIFTEYRATQNWLQEVLSAEGFTDGDRLLTMYGGMDPEKREEVKASFQTSPDVSPVRILLATDAASEGLDFQNFCSKLIHYEIPWNPNRLEQRNGRVDRHGQKADKVLVYHFVGKGYLDRAHKDFSGRASELEADLPGSVGFGPDRRANQLGILSSGSMTPERVIVESAYALACSLPNSTAEAVATAILTCSEESLRAEISKRVAHHHHREMAQAFVDRWKKDANEVDGRTVAVALQSASLSERTHRNSQSVELVWTGPDIESSPFRRTEQAILQVLDVAKKNITLVSFAVYRIPNVAMALVRAAKRGVRLTVIVETPDRIAGEGEYNTIKQLGQTVEDCSTVYYWPRVNRPVGDNNKVGILHVKCAVADSEWLYLSSANLTHQAFTINMELGMLLRGGTMPSRVEQQFEGLIQSGHLKQV
jgi:superfamily II DNA or RNA helicase